MSFAYSSSPNTLTCTTIQVLLCYTFVDPTLLLEALHAPGSNRTFIGTRDLVQGNKRLALVGDAALRMALVEDSYAKGVCRGPAQDRISRVASNANLASIGRRYRIDGWINPARGTMAVSDGTVADTVEAIIGAAYLDGGWDAARGCMRNIGLL